MIGTAISTQYRRSTDGQSHIWDRNGKSRSCCHCHYAKAR